MPVLSVSGIYQHKSNSEPENSKLINPDDLKTTFAKHECKKNRIAKRRASKKKKIDRTQLDSNDHEVGHTSYVQLNFLHGKFVVLH